MKRLFPLLSLLGFLLAAAAWGSPDPAPEAPEEAAEAPQVAPHGPQAPVLAPTPQEGPKASDGESGALVAALGIPAADLEKVLEVGREEMERRETPLWQRALWAIILLPLVLGAAGRAFKHDLEDLGLSFPGWVAALGSWAGIAAGLYASLIYLGVEPGDPVMPVTLAGVGVSVLGFHLWKLLHRGAIRKTRGPGPLVFLLALSPLFLGCPKQGEMSKPKIDPKQIVVDAGPTSVDGDPEPWYQVGMRVPVEWGPVEMAPGVSAKFDGEGSVAVHLEVEVCYMGIDGKLYCDMKHTAGVGGQVQACFEADVLPEPYCLDPVSLPGPHDPLFTPPSEEGDPTSEAGEGTEVPTPDGGEGAP